MIINIQKPNLLASSIVYIYLTGNNLNGCSGITANDLGKCIDVKVSRASAVSEKTFDVEFLLERITTPLKMSMKYLKRCFINLQLNILILLAAGLI